MRTAGGLLLALLAAVPTARAEPPELVTDRPDQTESTAVVPRGRVQIETGLATTRSTGSATVDSHEIGGTLARIGIAEALELRLGWGGFVSEQARGVPGELEPEGPADAELGIKVRLAAAEGSRPAMALLVGSTLPTGDRAVSSRRADPAVLLAFSQALTDRLGLGYNLGLAWASEPGADGRRHTLSDAVYSLALAVGLGERLGAFVELFGASPASASGPPRNSIDGGVTYLLRPNLQLDAALGLGLSEQAPDRFLGVGVSVRWPD